MKHPLSTANHTLLRFCTLLAVLVLGGVSVASALQTTVMLQGRVLDEKTGQPVIVKYALVSASGKTLKGKSLEDGTFKQVVQSGENYTITFNNYNVVKSTANFAIPASDKYIEEKKDFSVRVLHPGDQLLSLAAFEKGKPSLTSEARTELEKIVSMLKENRALEVNMTVAADVVPKAVKSSSKKKSKKGKKSDNEETAASDNSPALVQARVDMLRAHLEQVDAAAAKRVTFINSPTPGDANLVVVIGEVKNRFE